MAAQALPPPDPNAPSPGPGAPGMPGAGGGDPSTQILGLVRTIISASRQLGMQVPGFAPIARQINDLMQEGQMRILQSQPAPEPQAPPV